VLGYSLIEDTLQEITVPAKKVDIHVQNENGEPIEGVKISAFSYNGAAPLTISPTITNAIGIALYDHIPLPTTDSSGNFGAWLFPEGSSNQYYVLSAIPPSDSNYNSVTQDLHVLSDQSEVIILPYIIPPIQLSTLEPAQIWVGLKNSDDVGTRFDLLAEAYVNGDLLTSGQLNNVWGGSSGFNNAKLNTISFGPFSPVDFPEESTLGIKLYVRNACQGPTHNSGTARLWFNDAAANSHIGATIEDDTNDYFLRDGFILSTLVGSGPKKKIDVAAGTPCSPFKTFGTWTITP